MLRSSFFFGATALLLLAGCGDDDGDTMAGTPDLGPPPEEDMGPPPPAEELFDECVIDEQCHAALGPTAFCRTAAEGWPEGFCTLPCADRTPCDDGAIFHHCIDAFGTGQTVCEEACDNSFDCREGYICAAKGVVAPTRGLCVGYCQTDDECGSGAECNPDAGECVAPGTVPTGAGTGEACADDDGCLSGSCNPGDNSGTPTGWNNGYCLGRCALASGWNSNDLFAGDALPTNCADGNVCFPTGDFTELSPGACVSVCNSDADCRQSEGYACLKTFGLASGSKTFTNGVCFPVDCSETACPAGYSCQTVSTSSGTDSVCAPS